VLGEGDSVILCDDLLATGGTLAAAIRLVKRCGAKIEAVSLLMDIDIGGRDRLPPDHGKIHVLF
jgi:adenine phosphoribosyltransferase